MADSATTPQHQVPGVLYNGNTSAAAVSHLENSYGLQRQPYMSTVAVSKATRTSVEYSPIWTSTSLSVPSMTQYSPSIHPSFLLQPSTSSIALDQYRYKHGVPNSWYGQQFESSGTVSAAAAVAAAGLSGLTAADYDARLELYGRRSAFQPTTKDIVRMNCTTNVPVNHEPLSSMAGDTCKLEHFAERFKQRRIRLGFTQADVGREVAKLNLSGVGTLSQSTICRFESLTLSHNNMIALLPILESWLTFAEHEFSLQTSAGFEDCRRRRTSIASPERRSLEAYFSVQPRPSSEKIAHIAAKLSLKKSVVRVWFCNQRQKHKRIKFKNFMLLQHRQEGSHELASRDLQVDSNMNVSRSLHFAL